jgi:hypothetical protein
MHVWCRWVWRRHHPWPRRSMSLAQLGHQLRPPVPSIFVGNERDVLIADVWSTVAETKRCHDMEVEVVEIFASVDTLARAPQERGDGDCWLASVHVCAHTHKETCMSTHARAWLHGGHPRRCTCILVSRGLLLVEIRPEGCTPTQQPPEFTPSLRLLPRGFYFYLRKERKR